MYDNKSRDFDQKDRLLHIELKGQQKNHSFFRHIFRMYDKIALSFVQKLYGDSNFFGLQRKAGTSIIGNIQFQIAFTWKHGNKKSKKGGK